MGLSRVNIYGFDCSCSQWEERVPGLVVHSLHEHGKSFCSGEIQQTLLISVVQTDLTRNTLIDTIAEYLLLWLPGFFVSGKFCKWWNPDFQIREKRVTLGKLVELHIYIMESRTGARTYELEHQCKLGPICSCFMHKGYPKGAMFSIQMLCF